MPHFVDDLLGALADGADGVDLPRLLPLAGQLDKVYAAGPLHMLAERAELLDDFFVFLFEDS